MLTFTVEEVEEDSLVEVVVVELDSVVIVIPVEALTRIEVSVLELMEYWLLLWPHMSCPLNRKGNSLLCMS